MTPSDSTPKLPLWIFLATDAALLGAAVLIARESARPLSPAAMTGIVACVLAGALAVLIPLVARYERQKNETLDERQRALEALARTVSTSAEQISIAASGLHGIAELAQKNLRHADQLPHKLQEKIAEFKAQLAESGDAEKEELEKELVALRTTESERLESASTRLAKTAAELAKLEVATHQHLTTANEAVAKLAMGTAAAIGKAQAAAEQALAQARVEAARNLGEAGGAATRTIEAAKNSALAEIDTKLTTAGDALVERLARELSTRLAAITSVSVPAVASAATPSPAAAVSVSSAEITEAPSASTPEAPGAGEAPKTETTAHPPKRPRKARREETESVPAAETTATTTAAPASAVEDSVATSAPEAAASVETSPATEPPRPIEANLPAAAEPASAAIPEPVTAPTESAPPAESPASVENSPAAAVPTEVAATPAPPIAAPSAPSDNEAPKIPKKRTPRKTEESSLPEEAPLELGIPDAPAAASSERMLTSDGATRVLVTAYIGIGNRLFIRGSGPGLTWEKGVPLQFVSIGKWRWETAEATGPVEFKLYKNDLVECTALGAQSLDPGYQQEVTAGF